MHLSNCDTLLLQLIRATEGGQDGPEGSKEEQQAGVAVDAARIAAEVVANPLFYLVAGLVAIKLVASTGEQSLSIFLFAAAPVTLLTLLSKSDLGKQVQQQLEAKLPELDSKADALKAEHALARQSSVW
jgi:light-harvesting complex II chlorophyll a/b binding protein 7